MWLLERQPTAAAHDREILHSAPLGVRANGRVVQLPIGKTTIGSGARCTLRIEQPGVQPLHCLIVYATDGASVRRWATGTQLNGESFDDARLAVGDRLSIGSVELEIVDLQSDRSSGEQVARPAAKASVAFDPAPERTGQHTAQAVPDDAAGAAFRQFQTAGAFPRGRRRKLFTVLRRNRDDLHRLARRVEHLEQHCGEWDTQRADWQQQLSRWESRLADHTRRLDELQQELTALEPIRVRAGEAPAEPHAATPRLSGRFAQSSLATTAAECERSETSPPPPPPVEPPSDQTVGRVPPAATGQSDSFIERYAHLLTDEDAAAGEAPPAATEPVAAEPVDRGAFCQAGDPQPSSHDAEEESVEQYMAKLLERVRGETSRPPATQPQPIATPADPPLERGPGTLGQMPLAAAAPPPISPLDSSYPIGGHVPSLFDAGKLNRAAPSQKGDLEALRALANETARRAISSHALRKHRRTATTKVIVATLAGMTSLWLMLQAPHWRDLQFIVACLSMLVATYWAAETYRTLVALWDVVTDDGSEDEEAEDAEVLLRSPLPIDVEGGR